MFNRAGKSGMRLEPIPQEVRNSTKSITGTNRKSLPVANTSTSKAAKKNEKKAKFDPDKIAEEVRFKQLQETFDEADERNGLNLNEFRDAMRRTVGNKMTDDELELLFMKLDASCDGLVDWDEYVTYNLLEYQGKTLMKEMMRERPFRAETRSFPSRHRESIVAIDYYPNVRKRDGKCFISYTNGRYITLSKEGILSIWTLQMKCITTFNCMVDIGDRATQPWIVGLACLYNVGMIALSSTDRDITIFDIQSGNFLKRYHLTGLEDCITCMNYWVDPDDFNQSRLFWGDTSGSVCMIVFSECQIGGLFGSFGGKMSGFRKISVPEVIRGFYKGARGYRFNKIHGDLVLRVKFIPSLKGFISCSQTTDHALCLHKWVKKKKTVTTFKITKGVLCFQYCTFNNIIITGGMDCWVRAWNPYIPHRAIYILKGHTRPISHIVVNSVRNQIISFDKGRNIRVTDMRDQTCLQHISGRVIKMGNYPFSSVYFNPVSQTLIIATNELAILPRTDEEEKIVEIKSHVKPVVAALFNKTFKYVVSACQNSVISVWDLYTGEKIIQAVNAHVREERGIEVPVEITAMCFDEPQRCLVTGARDGSIKIWNFNNGNCMHTFNTPAGLEITGVVCAHHRILTSGWSRRVHIYIVGGGEEHRKDWKQKHSEDILCMSYLSPNIIATGSYDGDIVVWSRDTGHVYCTLNANKGTKPIGDAKGKNIDSTSDSSLSEVEEKVDHVLPITFEDFALESSKRMKIRKASLLRQNKDILCRVKENVLQKENTWSRKLVRPDHTPVDHPLLPLFEGQTELNSTLDGPMQLDHNRNKYDEICKNYEAAVECILFLAARNKENGDTASLLTSGAEGWVRAWSIHHQGGLLGQFNAAHKVGESVHTMSTDKKNHYLFTADSSGYVKTWDLTEYCKKSMLTKSERQKRWVYLNKTFTYVRFTYDSVDPPDTLISMERKPPNIGSRPPPTTSLPKITTKWPFLVNSFRAHTKMVNHIEFVDSERLLITASSDCTIRVWTLEGRFIGTFGETWESIPKLLADKTETNIRVPSDIRRSGSSSTLKVLNQGRSRMWQIAIDGARKIVRTLAEERERDRELERLERLRQETLSPCILEDRGDIVPVVQARPKLKQPKPSIEGGSDILGKSYKKTMGHRMPPTVDKFVEINSTVCLHWLLLTHCTEDKTVHFYRD